MGVNLECDEETGLIKIKQPVLIDCEINAVGLDNGMSKEKYTPAGYCVPSSGSLNYISIV